MENTVKCNINHGKQLQPLTLIVGVSNHLEVVNLLASIDQYIEVIIVLNNTPLLIKKTLHYLSFDNFDLKILEIPLFSLGMIKNVGIKNAKNDNVLFLDADNVLEKGTLKKVIGCLKKCNVGRVNIHIETNSFANKIFAANRVPHKNNSCYSPGLFFRKSIIDKIGGYYYKSDLPWREDYQLGQRLQENYQVHFLEDAVVSHPPYIFTQDLKTAFRCGGAHYIGCVKGYIKPTLKWGGGKSFLKSVIHDIYRAPYLLLVLFCQDTKRFGIVPAVYKLFWKLVFTSGYYSQLCFNFLKTK
jgi:glycosyltransferase involved in cell wall biosynthesis